jgi:hypothetical protein
MAFGTRAFGPGALLLLLAHSAFAAVSIQYTIVPVGGNVYRYVYSITNNAATGSAAIQLFDILFDTSLYQESSLQIVTPAPLHTQWSEQLLSSAPSVPAAYDALSLTGGIAAGSTVTGFSVQFTWLGTGNPGSQPFQVFDPNTFAVLQSGVTSTLPVGVPAASTLTLFLLGVGLSLAAAFQMRERLAGRT